MTTEATESSPLVLPPPPLLRTNSLQSQSSVLETKSASARPLPVPFSSLSANASKPKGEGKAEGGRLGTLVYLGYAFGHAQNDLCAAMYFSYLLVYLEGIGMSPVDAGLVLIIGQIVDGCATPLVGVCSDRWRCFRDGCCWGLAGRRKSWHIGGVLLVTATFWLLFAPAREGLLGLSPVAHYAAANALFQLGWAAVQVSHMALVPEITPRLCERTALNAIRYAVTVATSIAVYLLLLAFQRASPPWSTGDALQTMSGIVTAAGAAMAIAFVALVREHDDVATPTAAALAAGDCGPGDAAAGEGAATPRTLRDWYATPGFFGVVANYALVRLCGNTLQMYLPFYAVANMADRPTALSTLPLMLYVGMILSSAAAPRTRALVTDALWLSAGAVVLVATGGAALLLLADPVRHAGAAFLVAGVFGVGAAQLMVASQTQVCELVGNDPGGGAVFGVCSLCDKLSTAVVISAIQRGAQVRGTTALGAGEATATATAALGSFYRVVTGVGPLACALLACASLLNVPRSVRDRDGCNAAA